MSGFEPRQCAVGLRLCSLVRRSWFQLSCCLDLFLGLSIAAAISQEQTQGEPRFELLRVCRDCFPVVAFGCVGAVLTGIDVAEIEECPCIDAMCLQVAQQLRFSCIKLLG